MKAATILKRFALSTAIFVSLIKPANAVCPAPCSKTKVGPPIPANYTTEYWNCDSNQEIDGNVLNKPIGKINYQGHTACLVGYTFDPAHKECSDQAASTCIYCANNGTYHQEVWNGGGCTYFLGIFVFCTDPHQTQNNLRDNKQNSACPQP